MPGQHFGPLRAAPAGADLSGAGNINRAVVRQNDGSVVRAAGLGARCLGILTDAPKQGQTASVQVGEGGKWEAAAAFNAGVPLTTDAQGRAVEATVDGQWVLAYAEEAAAGAGHVVSVEITHAGKF